MTPKRKINNPQKIIIYAKWKFFIKSKNDDNLLKYNNMLDQIADSWDNLSQDPIVLNPTVNDVTKIFKMAYTIIWQPAHDNGMYVIIPLTHKMYNQRCRMEPYMTDQITVLLDNEINLIYSQQNLMDKIQLSESIMNNSLMQHKLEDITTQLNINRNKINYKFKRLIICLIDCIKRMIIIKFHNFINY